MTLESAGRVARAEPKTGWPPKPGPSLQHEPDHIHVASSVWVSSSLSNTRIPDPDGSVAALEPIGGSQVWQAGGVAVGAESQDASSHAGTMTARPVSQPPTAAPFPFDHARPTALT